MTNKQQVQQPTTENDPWELTIDNLRKWLLGNYNAQRQVLEDAKKKVKETPEIEVDPKILDELLEQNLSYNEDVLERRHKEILKLVISPRTGKFWDIPALQQANKLSDAQVDHIRIFHNGREPPSYYVTQIERRVDDEHNEWLIVLGMFEGLDKDGERVNKSLRLGYYNLPQLQWRYVPSNPRDGESEQIRIPIHNWRYFYPDGGSGLRVYNIPYSKETFHAILKHTRRPDPTDKNMGVSLSFHKAGAPNPMSVKSIEQFTTENFEEEWKKLTAPPAAKDLANFVQEFKKQNQQQDNKPQAEFLKDFLKDFVAEFRRQSIAEVDENTEHYK